MSECTKIRYANQRAALNALHAVNRRRSAADKHRESSIYPCPECVGWWHLTSNPAAGKWGRRKGQN